MNKSLIYIIGIILFYGTLGFSQQTSYMRVSYKLIDEYKKKAIPYAHIYNETKRFGAIADSVGNFTISASKGDTLILMALGYLGTHYQVKESDFDTLTFLKLLPRTYDIEPVNVTMPQSYESFKQSFMKADADKEKVIEELPTHNSYKTPYLLDTNITHTTGFRIFHPVSGLYYRFSKVEKSKRKVWYLQQQELRQREVDEKFNREMASQITGYTGDELTKFIGFCNFSFNYLLEAIPYDIILAIEKKQKEYHQCCYDKDNTDSKSK